MSGTLTMEAPTKAGTAANERLTAALAKCRTILAKVEAHEGELMRLRNLSADCAAEIMELESSIDPADGAAVEKLWRLSTQRRLADSKAEQLSQKVPVAEDDAAAAMEAAKACAREALRPIYTELEAKAIHGALMLADGEAGALQLVRSTAKFQWLSRVANAATFGFAADVPAIRKAVHALEVIASGDAESLLAWPARQ